MKNRNIFQFARSQILADENLAILKALLHVSPLQNDPEKKMGLIPYGETSHNFLSFQGGESNLKNAVFHPEKHRSIAPFILISLGVFLHDLSVDKRELKIIILCL